MAFGIEDFIDGVRASRQHFLKHLKGLKDAQWDWKPYPECKSIRETLMHMIIDDRAFIQILETGGMPDYEGMQENERDLDELMALMAKSHDELCSFIRVRFADTSLDAELPFIGRELKLGRILANLSQEDHYHAGQVAFMRMATDPAWDYYAGVYGGE